jgi:hypothetical protein
MFTRLILALSLLALTACQNAPYRPEYAMPRYDYLEKIPVNAASVRVVQQYRSPNQKPYVENEFPVPIAAAAEQWVKDRIEAAGVDGEVVFTIADAQVKEDRLSVTQGFKGAFTKDQEYQYVAHLVVHAKLQNTGTGRAAFAEANQTIMRTLPEKASIQEREILFYNMMKTVIEGFNTNMEAHLRSRFRP